MKLTVIYGVGSMLEGGEVLSTEEQTYYYGQDDHVRLYGRNYVTRLKSYGIRAETYVSESILHPDVVEKMGLVRNDMVIVCTKIIQNVNEQPSNYRKIGFGSK